jgi:hypothetical protein
MVVYEYRKPMAPCPPVYWQNQNGMLGVFVSPNFATDEMIYLTYTEPGEYGGSQVLARGKLNLGRVKRIENLEVLWRQMPRGKGGQAGGQVAFSPDGKYLFMSVGDRQRMLPAQDPNQPVGKILRLTLDGKPAPGNPNYGKTGASTIDLIDPPRDTEVAKTAMSPPDYLSAWLRPRSATSVSPGRTILAPPPLGAANFRVRRDLAPKHLRIV